MRGTSNWAIVGLLFVGGFASISAGEPITLLNGVDGGVRNLLDDGDADTELVWRGGYRGGWGGYRGGYGYRGWGGYGNRGWGAGGWGRGYGWGGYRPYYWGGGYAYRPWRWGGYGVWPYASGWGGSYGGYYGGYSPYYYYTPSYYFGCNDAPSASYALTLPQNPGQPNGNGYPIQPPPSSNGDGTYPYNGDPQPPASPPISAPPRQPSPKTLPVTDRLVSSWPGAHYYTAYGETAPTQPVATTPVRERTSRYTYQAYGDSESPPIHVSQSRR